ncbi:hypothetical protein GOP47_0009852 [Adiantum capillus-veneris]|uniref:Uncharacterized protein n=1 Tax=Adiantum capillus-veneris TaxID=13818 RepID=A0A9D4ZJV8_ADICA|nr:hypothetical protein GOP47_0009852 [Adiantum capillus-veneris]
MIFQAERASHAFVRVPHLAYTLINVLLDKKLIKNSMCFRKGSTIQPKNRQAQRVSPTAPNNLIMISLTHVKVLHKAASLQGDCIWRKASSFPSADFPQEFSVLSRQHHISVYIPTKGPPSITSYFDFDRQ